MPANPFAPRKNIMTRYTTNTLFGAHPSSRQKSITVLASGALAAALVAGVAAPATAAAGDPPVISTTITQTDGTPNPATGAFDATDAAGYDSSATNGIVRTNDTITYDVGVGIADADATDVTITLELPQGQELVQMPPFCKNGSTVTPDLAAPALPVTPTSYQSLPRQTVSCIIGDQPVGSSFQYPFVTKVRPEMPNGTVMDDIHSAVTSTEVTTPAVSSDVHQTVSARSKFDLSKNGMAGTENSGYQTVTYQACRSADLAGEFCAYVGLSLQISVPQGGVGSTPLAEPITFTDNLDPASLYGAAVLTDPEWIAAGSGALAKYGARMTTCATNSSDWSVPGHKIGAAASITETNSVRDSGTATCTQPGPGEDVQISISGADTTAYTSPTKARDGRAVPSDRAYVAVMLFEYEIPIDALKDLGTADRLNFDNKLTDFNPTDIGGQSNIPGADEVWNNHRGATATAQPSGTGDKQFASVGGSPAPGTGTYAFGWLSGPTGASGTHSGDGIVLPGQGVISANYRSQNLYPGGSDVTVMHCDAWDNTTLSLTADDYAATGNVGQVKPSGGKAVWISGFYKDNLWNNATPPQLFVEYGTGTAGTGSPGSTCADGDSPTGWTTDPALVPGNDPALAADGIYTAVTKVRASYTLTPGTRGAQQVAVISIGLKALSNPIGTIVPNWASQATLDGTHTLSEIANTATFPPSTYNPATNVGGLGDRLKVGSAISRLTKDVKNPETGEWTSSTVPQYAGGQKVDYRLKPSLTAGADPGLSQPVIVEDCLPAEETFVSSTVTPEIVQMGAPAGSELACAANQTYIKWDLGSLPINGSITPIEYTAEVLTTATNGAKANRALISTTNDFSTVAQRSASAQIQVINPAGIKISKVASKPFVELNQAGVTTPRTIDWTVNFANINSPENVSNVDVIDVLPAQGLNGTDFTGTLEFGSAVVTAGTGIQVLYSKTPSADVNVAPGDASNASDGTTVWCDAPSGGSVVLGTGTAADCPTAAADVTALRLLRSGPFLPGDPFAVAVSMIPRDNDGGDVYINVTAGRAEGLTQPVGPARRKVEIVESSIGDIVWWDLDGDGIQDASEPGVGKGFDVKLHGTDSLGNVIDATTTTDADGKYLFDNLPSGDYTVTFSPDSAAAIGGYFTTKGAGTDRAADSDADTAGVASFTLGQADAKTDIDAGLAMNTNNALSLRKLVESAPGSGTFIEADSTDGLTGKYASGDKVHWQFVVKNTGDTVLTDLVLSDPDATDCDSTIKRLAPGESVTIECERTESASRVNIATVTDADTGLSATDSAEIDIPLAMPEEDEGGGLASTGVAIGFSLVFALAALSVGMFLLLAQRRRRMNA